MTREFKWKYEIGQRIKDEKRDLTIINKKYKRKERKDGKIENEKLYKYHCNKCSAILYITEHNLYYHNKGCSCCNGKTIIKGINDVATTHPNVIKYFANIEEAYKYSHGSNKLIKKNI